MAAERKKKNGSSTVEPPFLKKSYGAVFFNRASQERL
jgi:hypothetical protein